MCYSLRKRKNDPKSDSEMIRMLPQGCSKTWAPTATWQSLGAWTVNSGGWIWVWKMRTPYQWAWRAEYWTKEDYSWDLRADGICLARVWTFWGPATLNFLLISPCWNGKEYPIPAPPSYSGSISILLFDRFTVGEEFCLGVNSTSSLTYTWFRHIWMVFWTLDFRVDAGMNEKFQGCWDGMHAFNSQKKYELGGAGDTMLCTECLHPPPIHVLKP